MRQGAEFFGDRELELVYIAKRLREALALERILTERSVEYYVEPDTYKGGVIFPRTRVGAFFYVLPEDKERVSLILAEHGYSALERRD